MDDLGGTPTLGNNYIYQFMSLSGRVLKTLRTMRPFVCAHLRTVKQADLSKLKSNIIIDFLVDSFSLFIAYLVLQG